MNVLILGDFVGCGDVAMSVSRAVLTRMGHRALCLPTALISNTWNLGTPAVTVTTEYICQALESWEKNGISVDAVLLGYLADARQADWIGRRCAQWHSQGATVFLDPICADNGKLYAGITPQRLDFLRELLKSVDYVLPNATEACFLTGNQNPAPAAQALVELGAGAAVVTGVGECSVLLARKEGLREIPYAPIPGQYSGAGDAFTALFAGSVLLGQSPEDSAKYAAERVRDWIRHYRCVPDSLTGLPVERLWD